MSNNNLLAMYDVKLGFKPYGAIQTSQPINLGLIDNINLGSSRSVENNGEIGSDYTYSIITDGQGSLSFNRRLVVSKKLKYKNILAELFAPNDESVRLIIDLDESRTNVPIEFYLTLTDESNGGSIVAQFLLKDATIQSYGMSVRSGSNAIPESLSVAWTTAVKQETT